MQKSAKISKKFVYYNEELVTNSKFQTQLSRKLQRFRTCRKNKKCSIFHDLSEYIIFPYDCNLLDCLFARVSEIWNPLPPNKYFHENQVKETFLRFGSMRNRFLASNYPY